MHRIEMTALRSPALRWDQLVEHLPPALESIGLSHDEKATDGKATVLDHGEHGCTILMDNVGLSRRVALALAKRSGVAVDLYEVVGTAGAKRFRFQTTAWRATPAGEQKPGDGHELDLEDPEEEWGGGTLEERAETVLQLFAELDPFIGKTLEMGYRRHAQPRASTPRLAKILTTIKKAKSCETQPQPDGRFALVIELAAGGKQTSFCSKAEHDELEMLLGGKKP
jgi:hypothetical protein